MDFPSTSGYVSPFEFPENLDGPSTFGYMESINLSENMNMPSTSGYGERTNSPENMDVLSTLGYMPENMDMPSTSDYEKSFSSSESIDALSTFDYDDITSMLENRDNSGVFEYLTCSNLLEGMNILNKLGYVNPINICDPSSGGESDTSEDCDFPEEGYLPPSHPTPPDDGTDLLDRLKKTLSSEPEEVTLREYKYETKPAITSIKQVKLLSLKNVWRRVEVIKSDKFPKLKRRYFEELNDFINKWRHWDRRLALNPTKKECSLLYFISDILQYISKELGKADKKSPLLLKVFYYFFSSAKSIVEEKKDLKNKCNVSLRKFVTTCPKRKSLKYLLKDIAADILSQLSCVSLTSPAAKLFVRDFRYLQDSHEDSYGTTVAWLSNVTAETGAKLVHFEAKYSDALAMRALNSSRILSRLMSICESFVCCVNKPSHSETVPLSEATSLPSQAENVSEMEIGGQIEDVAPMEIDGEIESGSSRETKLLYDPNLVRDLNLLIRNENIYTPVFHFKYEHRLSKPFQFSELIFEDLKMRVLSHAVSKCPDKFNERETQDAFLKPKHLQEDTDLPQNFFVTEHKKSYIKDGSFGGNWDILSNIKTPVDAQLVYFGHMSALENLHFDIYSRETTNMHLISVSASDMDPQNVKRAPNVFDVFEMPEKCNKKPPRKRKLSPSV